jgi:hypothetical protein
MTPLTDRPRGELLLDLLLGALRVCDDQLNALAVELLGRCDAAPVRRLVQEAADPRNRPGHRLRALRAIRRIGRVTDLASYLDLSVLASDKHPAIRAAVAELGAELSQRPPALAEDTGRIPRPFAEGLPAGARSRALVPASDGRQG